MKTRTNQPVFYDNGQIVKDSELGGSKLYKHTLRFRIEEEDKDIDIVSIRGTAYPDLATISNEKNYEVLSYGYIQPEDMPRQVIGFEDTGMESFLIYYLTGGQIDTKEVSGFVSDTVTPL